MLKTKSVLGLLTLVMLFFGLRLASQYIQLKNLVVFYDPTQQIIEYKPSLQKNAIEICIHNHIKGLTFFTPLNIIKTNVEPCISPLNFEINKKPLNTLIVSIPSIKIQAKYYNVYTSNFGLLVTQQNKTFLIKLGKPVTQDFKTTSNIPIIKFFTTPKTYCCIHLISSITNILEDIPDIKLTQIIVYDDLQHPQQIELSFKNAPTLLLSTNLTQQDIENKLSVYLSVYAKLLQQGLNPEYIDLRFDRVIVK